YRDNAQGTVNRRRSLSWETFSNLEFVVPSFQEQRRIVDLIASVDSYIAALQQQADAARSARSAVLSELLSAGGDDWTETTLGDVLAIQSGFAFSTSDWTVKGYPVIKINNVRDGKVSTESCSFIADPIPQGAEKFLLKKGDLLITLTGEIGATGTVEQNFPMYLNQRVGRVSIHKESKVLLQYLAVLFNYPPVRAEMWSLGKGNAQLNISPKSIHEIEVNLPPLSEQRWTIEIISSMDEVIRSTEQAVADAKSLRSGLLSDLLSGAHEIPTSYDRFLKAA
ncbi:MAG: restriction endonuclease subunit S, partial [Planctomycetes bacterium]|nr:restriction endonuclease subunit S [Planctomycetota bacterium]